MTADPAGACHVNPCGKDRTMVKCMMSVLFALATGVAFRCAAASVTADGPWEMEQASAPGKWMPAEDTAWQ